MSRLFALFICFMSSSLYSGIVSISYSDELPDHVDRIVEDITIEMHLVEASKISELMNIQVGAKHSPVLLSNLKIKKNLGKRILWISGVLKFHAGREIRMKIPFDEMEQGGYINVFSIPNQGFKLFGYETSKNTEAVDSFFITGIAVK